MKKNSPAKQMLLMMFGVVLGYAIVFGLITACGVVDLHQPGGLVLVIVILCAAPFLPHAMGVRRSPDNKQFVVRTLDLKVILAAWIALLVTLAIPSWGGPVGAVFLGLLFVAWFKERAARRRARK